MMEKPPTPVCWICGKHPADTSEHKFKASDIRAKAPAVSQAKPIFLQRDSEATNDPIGSAKAKALTFPRSICAYCNNTLTQPFDVAWQKLSEYLHANWATIVKRGRFDLSEPFPGGTRDAALQVHLYFVKLFGCKLKADSIPISLVSFSKALLTSTAHPEVSILIADKYIGAVALSFESDVFTLRSVETKQIHGAVWAYVIQPVAIKVSYVKAGAPVIPPRGYPWHPSRPVKRVKLSPYDSITEPKAGPRALVS